MSVGREFTSVFVLSTLQFMQIVLWGCDGGLLSADGAVQLIVGVIRELYKP
ncbi:MAG: hypothetical protein OXF54_20625 [Caldilineaceae bacterium]|nr:hypothetical protein [Caldilineaceae bacterium]